MPPDVEFSFTCFTEDHTGLLPKINVMPLPNWLKGWWNKLYLFKNKLFNDGERILYFDLDTVITGSIKSLVEYKGPFAILRDFYRPDGLQSSVMSWVAGEQKHIWQSHQAAGHPEVEGGDQAWIERTIGDYDLWQDICPDEFVSYKVHCLRGLPSKANVVIFHGEPRPHEVRNGWMDTIWKIGGQKTFDYDLGANTTDEKLIENIKHAISLDAPWFSDKCVTLDKAAIVCGGPSLNQFKEQIKELSKDTLVFAVNGTAKWCKDNNIQISYHVILDARPENLEFVQDDGAIKLYASQCDKSVLQAAGENLLLWHPLIEGIQDLLPKDKYYALVGGGCTVGLKTMAITTIMGAKELHIFGMDSSYSEQNHHAYEQKLNDGEETLYVTVGEKTFNCAPWMAAQADEFQQFVPLLINSGVNVAMYGDGLVPYLTELMVNPAEETDDIKNIDGIYWPAYDSECRHYTVAHISDAQHFVEFCTNRRVAVQAGGNVGLFPKEFSKHFDQVITFEPDYLNYRCLALNAPERNIIKIQAALGYERCALALVKEPGNCGAHYVKDGMDFYTLRLDDLNLPICDLIQLDIEGYEFEALKGADKTIKRCSPVIVLELKGHEERYGTKEQDILNWLSERGYRQASRIHRDIVFVKQS